MASKRFKTVSFMVFVMAAIFLVLVVCEWQYNERHTIRLAQYSHHIPTVFAMPRMNRWQLIHFGSFPAIPNFYIKQGLLSYANADKSQKTRNLLTICSICSVDLLEHARTVAQNYKSGPLSFAVYIDADIHSHSMHSQIHLTQLFDEYFKDIERSYDISIGLIYANHSSPFYTNLNYSNTTEIAWKLPINSMRNLAEYQAKTEWLLSIDIDFEMFSRTINNASFLDATLNKTGTNYSDDTLFVVPSFATVPRYINEAGFDWNNLTKNELMALVQDEWIWQYYRAALYHNCTNYPFWYKTETDFTIKQNMKYCERHYEPNFIIKTNVSKAYQWDNRFTGHFLDRIQRVQYLRYHQFNAVVMSDLFIIHANKRHVAPPNNQTRRFYKRNIKLLNNATYHLN